MLITIEPDVRLFVDVEGPGLVPDGPRMREKPALVLLHGGPGYDHSSFKPLFSQLSVLKFGELGHEHGGDGNSHWYGQ